MYRSRLAGSSALDAVSVEVETGEVLGIIGPNGAGKTTLFNVICGFVEPDSGSLTWRGQPLDHIRPDRLSRLGIARTLQGVGLFGRLTVLENVMVGAQRFRRARFASALLALPGSDRDERRLRERAMTALDRVGCAELSGSLPGTLPYAVAEAGGARPRARLRAGPAAARRAGRRAFCRRAVRARQADRLARQRDRGDARGPPHGPGDLGLRPHGGARLREGDRVRRAARGQAEPTGARRVPGTRGRASRIDGGSRTAADAGDRGADDRLRARSSRRRRLAHGARADR